MANSLLYGDLHMEWRAPRAKKLLRALELNPSLHEVVCRVTVDFFTASEWGTAWARTEDAV